MTATSDLCTSCGGQLPPRHVFTVPTAGGRRHAHCPRVPPLRPAAEPAGAAGLGDHRLCFQGGKDATSDTDEAWSVTEALLSQGLRHVLGAALHRLERARTGRDPMTVPGWLRFADALESQASSIREWCAAVEERGRREGAARQLTFKATR